MYDEIMPTVTKGNKKLIEGILSKFGYTELIKPYNPYAHRCYKSSKYIVYTHSAIELFFEWH